MRDQSFDFASARGRWGLYGGTFDPIHRGHLYVAHQAMDALKLDGVIFLPSGDPPHKPGRVHTATAHRLAMVRLALENEPDFSWSDYELTLPAPQYTYATLESLAFCPAELIFIMGADSLLNFSKWRYPERILKAAQVAAVQRPGIGMDEMEAARRQLDPSRICLIPCPGLPASSSSIRQGERDSLDPGVVAYIQKEHLYEHES